MNWGTYFLQANLFLAVFYGLYWLILRKETFSVSNRAYLICSALLSLFLPACDSEVVQSWLITQRAHVVMHSYHLPVVIIGTKTAGEVQSSMETARILFLIYGCGVILFFLRFAVSLIRTTLLLRSGKPTDTAFAFFNRVIVDRKLASRDVILEHEFVHARQLHSLDVIFFELMGIFFWFNPVIYLYKTAIKDVHEFIADEIASGQMPSKADYALLLLSRQFKVSSIPLISPFFRRSTLRLRIQMLKRERSARSSFLKYALIFPLSVAMLVIVSASLLKGPVILPSEDPLVSKTGDPTIPAEFTRGGMSGLYRFIAGQMKYPEAAAREAVEGMVIVGFTIKTDGSISGATILKSIGYGCDEEALRVVQAMPAWKAASTNGKAVDSRYQLPVFFRIKEQKNMEQLVKLARVSKPDPTHELEIRRSKNWTLVSIFAQTR